MGQLQPEGAAKTGRRTGLKVLTVTLALLPSVGLAELVLRALVPLPQQNYVWKPNVQVQFQPEAGVMPGVVGPSQFTINAQGLRGELLQEDDCVNILCLGGSTTECLYLDDAEAWPRLLQDELGRRDPSRTYRVVSAGRDGIRMPHHLLQAEHLLERFEEIDVIVVLAGINDLLRKLLPGTGPVPKERLMKAAFMVQRVEQVPLNSRILYLLGKARERETAMKTVAQDRVGSVFTPWRKNRWDSIQAGNIQELPDDPSVYRLEGVEALAALAKQHGVRLVFLTQPVMWRADLPDDLSKLLWMGGTANQDQAGQPYYRAADLAQAMGRVNEHLRKTCAKQGVDCIDLAAELPQDGSVFYDDCHFNEGGALKVAQAVARQWPKSAD